MLPAPLRRLGKRSPTVARSDLLPPAPVHAALVQLVQQHPHAHAFTLALLLEAGGLGRYSGPQVRQWLDSIAAA